MNKTLRLNPHLMKVEHNKAAILTGRHLQNITAVFRAVEILLFLAVISRLTLTLPLALKLSGESFRSLANTLISPRFVFVVGNVIVITLFVKSGGRLPHPSATPATVAPPPPPEKSTTFVVTVYSAPPRTATAGKVSPAKVVSPPTHTAKVDCYRRSRSVVERKCCGGRVGELRRTKTEKIERSVVRAHKGEEYFPEDKMSGDEFRRTIEDFIARQQRFLREEEEEVGETLALAG